MLKVAALALCLVGCTTVERAGSASPRQCVQEDIKPGEKLEQVVAHGHMLWYLTRPRPPGEIPVTHQMRREAILPACITIVEH